MTDHGAAHRRAGRARDARRALVPGLAAQLRRARPAWARRRGRRRSPSTRARRPAPTSTLTCGELRDQVARARRRAGRPRCRAAATASSATCPNCPRGAGRLPGHRRPGAVWASCASEFGPRSVVDRFGQVEPVVLLVAGGYRYGARTSTAATRWTRSSSGLPSVRHVLDIEYGDWRVDEAPSWPEAVAARRPTRSPRLRAGAVRPPAGRAVLLGHDGTAEGDRARPRRDPARAPQEPRAVLGPRARRPACSGTRTTAWMMWNALVSALLVGASIVMVDGDPAYPDLGWQWRLAEETGATLMGASPGFVMACRAAGLDLVTGSDLRIRVVGSAGAPLPPEGYAWITRAARPRRAAQRRQRRHRRLHRPGAEQPAAAGARRDDLRARPRRRRARLRRGRPRGHRRARRAGDHRTDAVDAGRLLGRRRRQPAAGRRTSTTTRASGGTATGSSSSPTAAAWSPVAATRPSTAAASASAPPSSTASSRSSRGRPTASSSTSRTRPAATASCCSSWSPAPARARRRPASARIRVRAPRRALATPRPRPGRRGAGRPAQPDRQEAGAARSSGSCRARPSPDVASRDALADPTSLDAFVALAASRRRGATAMTASPMRRSGTVAVVGAGSIGGQLGRARARPRTRP